jgi:hypothetical protein
LDSPGFGSSLNDAMVVPFEQTHTVCGARATVFVQTRQTAADVKIGTLHDARCVAWCMRWPGLDARRVVAAAALRACAEICEFVSRTEFTGTGIARCVVFGLQASPEKDS